MHDLGSRNGTYVNGHRIDFAHIGEGDLLAVGHSRFTVRQGQLVASIDEGDVNFVANHLSYALPDGKKLLDDVSFALEGSSLLAVIGPSGAGKSTMLKALTGSQQATEGEVYYDGRDLYDNFQDLRHRIGVVPRTTSCTASSPCVRHPRRPAVRRPAQAHLGGARAADPPITALPRRADLGLDPGLDKQVMQTLRELADGGRTVVVVTHSVANLGTCDKVLLLAPGGKVAYFGPPDGMLGFFGTTAGEATAAAEHPRPAVDPGEATCARHPGRQGLRHVHAAAAGGAGSPHHGRARS